MKIKSRNPVIKFDKLKQYFGDPYEINLENTEGSITLFQPTIGDIIEIGEKKFYSTLNIFTTNTTQYRTVLWDIGLDWTVTSDFYLFTVLYKNIDPDVSKILFGDDIDWSEFVITTKIVNGKQDKVLYNQKSNLEINELVYFHISQYLRGVFKIYPEEKYTTDKILKKWWIDQEKREIARQQEKKKEEDEEEASVMQAIISSVVNHPGFKYKLNELKDIGVCFFWDAVQRLQVYEHATALLKGMFSGMISAKDIKPEEYNFMRELKDQSKETKNVLKDKTK